MSTIQRMVLFAQQGDLNSATNLLESCSLTNEQNNSITSILKKVQSKNLTPQDAKVNITSCLIGRAENKTQAIVLTPAAPGPIPTNHFLNFSSDLFSHILSFCNAIGLNALAVCCKTLYKAKASEGFEIHSEAPQILIVEELRKKHHLIRKEMNTYIEALGGKPGDWNCVLRHCPLLEELDLSYFCLYDDKKDREEEEKIIISLLLSTKVHCHSITKLNFTGCKKIGDATLTVLGEHFPNLTHLNLSQCNYSVEGIVTFLKCGKDLMSLDLSLRNNFEQKGSKVINSIADYCPNLRELDLRSENYISFLPKDPDEADNAIILLSMGCRNLEKLVMSYSAITDQSLVYLGNNCKNLTTLVIFDGQNITPKGKADIKQKLPKLEMPKPKNVFQYS